MGMSSFRNLKKKKKKKKNDRLFLWGRQGRRQYYHLQWGMDATRGNQNGNEHINKKKGAGGKKTNGKAE